MSHKLRVRHQERGIGIGNQTLSALWLIAAASTGCAAPIEQDLLATDEPPASPAALSDDDGLVDKALGCNDGANPWCETSDTSLEMSADSHVCFLNEVKGDFGGNTSRVSVSLANGVYQLGRNTAQDERGSMTCTKWSNFIGAPGASRGNHPTGNIGNSQGFNYDWDQTFDVPEVDGSFASAISKMQGEFEGGGEYIQVNQPTTAGGGVTVRLHSQCGDIGNQCPLVTTVFSARLGNNGTRVKLIGYDPNGNKIRDDIQGNGDFFFDVATDSGFSGFLMANTSSGPRGICYFTRLTGDFNGTNERAQITENAGAGVWQLTAAATSDDYVRARARCMAYDQR